jgi:biopolymer transport protein ExbB/TolQ
MASEVPPTPAFLYPWWVKPLAWGPFSFFAARRIGEPGLDYTVGLLALVLTFAFYCCVNAYFLQQTEQRYETLFLKEFASAETGPQAADRAIQLRWADPKLLPWLRKVMAAPSPSYPAHRQIEAFFASDFSTPEAVAERRSLLHGITTGNPAPSACGRIALGLVPLPGSLLQTGLGVELQTQTGSELFERLTAADHEGWRKAVDDKQPLAEEKRRFIVHYLDVFVARMQEPIRDTRRLNGWVQWCTVFVTFALLLVILRRYLLIVKLRRAAWIILEDICKGKQPRTACIPRSVEMYALFAKLWTGPTLGEVKPSLPPARGELRRIRESVEGGAHNALGYLVTLLPTLGFLGTVLGLGDALLRADGLFSAQDKQQVIGLITQDLGFAFDTTYVALVCGMIVGIPLCFLRLAESKWFADFERHLLADDSLVAPYLRKAPL